MRRLSRGASGVKCLTNQICRLWRIPGFVEAWVYNTCAVEHQGATETVLLGGKEEQRERKGRSMKLPDRKNREKVYGCGEGGRAMELV